MPTSTVENYLKTLYSLQQQGSGRLVALGKLADAVDVTPGTATTMIKRLAETGLVEYESHEGARLSPRGKQIAVQVLRRHRLIELFLIEVLGYDWGEVHEEAEVLEHAVSDRLLQKIDDMLGHPAFDPHGAPIPSASGKITHRRLISLAQCDKGDVEIASVSDEDQQFLGFLSENQLTPGTKITINTNDPVADMIDISLPNGRRIQLGMAAAKKIMVVATPTATTEQTGSQTTAC